MNNTFNAAFAVLMTAVLSGCQTSQAIQSGSSTYNGDRAQLLRKPQQKSTVQPNEAKSMTIKKPEKKAAVKKPAKTTVNEAASSAIKGKNKHKKVVLVARKNSRTVSSKKSKYVGSYRALVTRYARANGVPVALAHAVVKIESNYRANSRGRAGEVGLMQIKHATARGVGYRGSRKALYNPETNIKYGMKYLAGAYRKGGKSTCGAILKYNAGHGAKRMNKISAAYCRKVKRVMKRG